MFHSEITLLVIIKAQKIVREIIMPFIFKVLSNVFIPKFTNENQNKLRSFGKYARI